MRLPSKTEKDCIELMIDNDSGQLIVFLLCHPERSIEDAQSKDLGTNKYDNA